MNHSKKCEFAQKVEKHLEKNKDDLNGEHIVCSDFGNTGNKEGQY